MPNSCRKKLSEEEILARIMKERHWSILEALTNIITSGPITVAAAIRVADRGNDLH